MKEREIKEATDRKYEANEEANYREIESLNWHVWPNCNYKCKFCFATFQDKEHLKREDYLKIPPVLAHFGVKKINYVGGEPMLFPHLGELLSVSKQSGLVTSIVTNGSMLTRDFLDQNQKNLDWIGISIDSSSENTERMLGRGNGRHVRMAVKAASTVKEYGIKLKINTVVTQLNYNDDMRSLISELEPDRWKVFQFLPIEGENDRPAFRMLITNEQFMEFVKRHEHLRPVYEDNNAMTGSYIMIDPLGRLFQNWNRKYRYSTSILEIGFPEALGQVGWDSKKYIERGGRYKW